MGRRWMEGHGRDMNGSSSISTLSLAGLLTATCVSTAGATWWTFARPDAEPDDLLMSPFITPPDVPGWVANLAGTVSVVIAVACLLWVVRFRRNRILSRRRTAAAALAAALGLWLGVTLALLTERTVDANIGAGFALFLTPPVLVVALPTIGWLARAERH